MKFSDGESGNAIDESFAQHSDAYAEAHEYAATHKPQQPPSLFTVPRGQVVQNMTPRQLRNSTTPTASHGNKALPDIPLTVQALKQHNLHQESLYQAVSFEHFQLDQAKHLDVYLESLEILIDDPLYIKLKQEPMVMATMDRSRASANCAVSLELYRTYGFFPYKNYNSNDWQQLDTLSAVAKLGSEDMIQGQYQTVAAFLEDDQYHISSSGNAQDLANRGHHLAGVGSRFGTHADWDCTASFCIGGEAPLDQD